MTEFRTDHLAYRFALDPTPRQARELERHARGARFAFNWGLSRIAAALDARAAEIEAGGQATTPIPGHMQLCPAWTVYKNTAAPCLHCRHILIQQPDGGWTPERDGDCEEGHEHEPRPRVCTVCGTPGKQAPDGAWRPTVPMCTDGNPHNLAKVSPGLPWIGQVFAASYHAALRDADRAWKNFFASRSGQRRGRAVGRPRFKSAKRSTPAFQMHGPTLRLADATHIILPKIGRVTVMSDDSHHPAMLLSRSHTPGQRHMGNRRRARQAWRQLQEAQRLRDRAVTILAALRNDKGLSLDDAVAALNVLADAHARAAAVQKVTKALTAAQETLAAVIADPAADSRKKNAAAKRVEKATEALHKADAPRKASRTDAWSKAKLADIEQSGALTVDRVRDLATVYEVAPESSLMATLLEVAQQIRIVRANISRGADGLWWLSLSLETPAPVRQPTKRQRRNGAVGVDFGVRELARLSDRPDRIRNPRYLQRSLEKIRVAQKRLSRCEPGSRRRDRARALFGLLHADVARQREAALHRATTKLTRRYEKIGVEGWDVQKAMAEGSADLPKRLRRKRNRALADTGIGIARHQLGYKTARAGTTLVVAEPGAPTGRTCSVCGQAKTKPVPPHHELFACEVCGYIGPRRLNTARVLQKAASGSGPLHGGSAESRGGDVTPETARGGGQSSMKRAASTRLRRGETGTPGP